MEDVINEICGNCNRIVGEVVSIKDCPKGFKPTGKYRNITTTTDLVNHPTHYTESIPNIECIQVTEHMNFCRGNAIKYIWRAGWKDKTTAIEDLKKARWYLDREIARLSNHGGSIAQS